VQTDPIEETDVGATVLTRSTGITRSSRGTEVRTHDSSERRWRGAEARPQQPGYSEAAHGLCVVLQPSPSLQLMDVTAGEGGGRGCREMEQKLRLPSQIASASPQTGSQGGEGKAQQRPPHRALGWSRGRTGRGGIGKGRVPGWKPHAGESVFGSTCHWKTAGGTGSADL